ncbi:hypothetical protein Taro_037287 [Colocasia esculenta]|uniref:Uncharacterized protein n=1 Tax=Colocasia esculenta TaxID=4460 RepID=A0A843WCD8_COLES|nr:hypothetical protein [Colocasia esculenta]
MGPDQPATSPRICVDGDSGNDLQDPRMPPSPPVPSFSNAFVSSPWDIVPSHSYAAAAVSPYRCLTTVTKRCGRILSLALSDAGLLYAGTESKAILVWRHQGFFEISRLRSGSGGVGALHVASKDGLVFSAHADLKVRVWSSKPFHVRMGTLPSSKDFLIEACRGRTKKALMKFSASHSYTMFGGARNRVRHSGAITSLAYDPAAKLLYSASSDGSIKVWSVKEMKCVETVEAHDGSVSALAFGPDGVVFSGSDDCTVKIWLRSAVEKRSHRLLLEVSCQGSPVTCIAVSAEGTGVGGSNELEIGEGYILYAGCSDGNVRYWKKGEEAGGIAMAYLGCLRGHSHEVLCLAAVEKLLVSGSADASVRVWRRSGDGLAAHECTAVLCGHIGPVKALAATVEGEEAYLVYSGSLDGSVKQWRV